LFLTGCGIDPKTSDTATSETPVITATIPATAPLHQSSTPLPPTPQPTLPPVEGITSTQLNVRAEPSTTSEVLGIITANSKVQITGRDIGDNWWQIIYETGADGKGWITAQYVDTEDNSQVPVIGGDDSNPNSGNTAIVIQQLNIRSGPGTDFDSLGILNENDVINLTGKNRNGTWLQFDFSNSPEGKGWVSSGFVKADDSIGLPIVSDEGDVIGTGTPVDTPLPPTPTIVPAPMDFDTAENPIKTVILGGVGTHTVLYNGDVSFPKGDTEDWILIIPQENALFVAVDCLGNNLIQIGIIGMQTNITCGGNIQSISVSVDVPLLIHIQAIGPADQLQYTRYILEIKVNP
jgi:uncharacterized protein YraI